MIGLILRTLWRIFILVVGATALWSVVFILIPIVDSRFPVFVALLFAYIVLAYIIIPNLIRLFRLVIKPNHIPLYVTTGDGWPSDPVNIAIITKNRRALETAMKSAGWHLADPMTFRTALRALGSFVFNTAYVSAPLSTLYLFGRKQDIGFEIPTGRAKSMRTRHHVRFWRLDAPLRGNDARHPHTSFWQRQFSRLLDGQQEIWIGAATEEMAPLDIQWYTGRLTHGGSHDADRERDFIIQSLRDKKIVKRVTATKPGEAVTFRGQQFRTIYVTDGSIKVVRLR